MIRFFFVKILLILTFPLFSQPQRPMDMWVFRCVLDGKPKSLVAALHKDLYVGYDTDKCQLQTAWKGGVNFSGAVYSNTKHGPQPTSKGPWYFHASLSPVWKLMRNGIEIPCKIQFRGYVWKGNQLKIQYDLLADSSSEMVSLEEWPEYVLQAKTGKMGLQRQFTIKANNSQLQVMLMLEAQGMNNLNPEFTKGDLLINQPASLIQKTENYTNSGTIYSVLVAVTLANKPTMVTTFFTETNRQP